MTSILETIQQAMIVNTGDLQNSALSLLGILCVIDLVLTIAMNFDHDYPQLMIKKIITYGIWFFLITNYSSLVKIIMDGFIWVGTNGVGDLSLITNPDKIFIEGLIKIVPLYEKSKNSLTILTGFSWVPLLITYVIGVIAYGIIAIQIFITFVEFSIISSVAVIFLPFGVLPRTAFLAEKAIGAIISFGTKMMVLSCILVVLLPEIDSMPPLDAEANLSDLILEIAKACAIAFLTLQAPAVAGSLLSGGPSLSAGTVAGSASGAATMAAAAVSGAGKAASKIASGAGKATSAYKAYSSASSSSNRSQSNNIDKSGMSFDDKKS